MDNYLALVKNAANADEAWEERRFQVYRSGGAPLVITLFDQGPNLSGSRFSARAESNDGHGARIVSNGNPDSTVEGALSNIHWWDFD
jgi:hypothetical protein